MVILAVITHDEIEEVVDVGQYGINAGTHTAEVALVVRDDCQEHGIGTELLTYLTQLAMRQGHLGFTAEILFENQPILHLFEKMGFDIERRSSAGMYELKLAFRGISRKE
ncbi:MAG: GNAT family N-acetyltransferase [Candidatus Heimdallarchaeota archaeon]